MSTLAGTGDLAKLAGRRDRIMIPAWIYVLTALVAGTAYSFRQLYPTQASRSGFAATAGHNPALLALYGPLSGDSLGSLTAWRYGSFAALGAGLMSVFIVIRHTRADEETGRLELVGSAAVGRNAALVAALLVALASNAVLAVLMSAGLIALGLAAAGSVALALAIASCGLVFTAVAALTAQIADSARRARGIAIAVLGVAYLLRAVGDAAGAQGPRWLTWLSPAGWTELIRPFDAARWWVLALPLLTAAAVAAVAATAAVRRDYDAGLLPQRHGPPRGAASLRSPLALAWRLHRGTLIGWVTGALVYGVIIGSAAKGISGLLSSPQVRHIVSELGGTSMFTDAYLAAIMSFGGLIAAGFGISVVLRLRSEETAQHADALLATSVGRARWALSHLAIAVAGTATILVMAGLGAGLGYAMRSAGGARMIGPLVGAGLVQVPAALVIAGIAAAIFGFSPRASAGGGWAVLAAAVLMLLLGPTLRLSHWILDLSPFTHIPKLPGGAFTATPVVYLCVLALALGAVSLAGLRRRDIG